MSDRVGIFWDYSSCPTSDTSDESSIALSLRKDCVQHGHVVLFKAYFGLPDSTPFEPPSESIRSKIEGVGVVTVDHPKAGFGAFSTDIFCFLMDNHELPVSTTIVLVSGNPDIAYLVSALYARGVRVGLVAPSGQLDKLSSQTSWTENWDNYTVAFGSSSVVYHPSQSSISLKRPSDTPVAPRRTKARYTTTLETIPQPLHQVQAHGTLCEPYLYTSSHKLQMFENDPLYIELIKDPEAIKVKTWRRELKQLFFYQDITTNPNVQGELDALITSLEQYDKMTKNYLTFSKIGKLLTQIIQAYTSHHDYRRTHVTRAKDLLIKWEPLARSSNN